MKSSFAGRIVFAGALLSAAVAPAKDWYVDANYGNNEWDGSCKYADRDEGAKKGPKKWLSEAMMIPDLGENDVVHAAEGIYNEGEMWDGYNTNRVILAKAGLGLVADGRREKTIIEGAISSAQDCGNGAGAIRCVRFTGQKSYVRGFIIRKGRTDALGSKTWEYAGGGAYSYTGGKAIDKVGRLVDCVLTNCNAAYRGVIGCSEGVTAIGCVIYAPKKNLRNENYVSCGCNNFINSVVWGQPLGSDGGGIAINSTFPDDGPWKLSAAYNCYIRYLKNETTYYNCLYVSSPAGSFSPEYPSKRVTEAQAKFEAGTYRPLRGSVLIDAGLDSLYLSVLPESLKASLANLAMDNKPRFRGAAIDIGAFEYENADDLAPALTDHAYFTVSDATYGVSTEGTGVNLASGSSFNAAWALPSGEVVSNGFTIVASAGEGAVLNIYLNGSAEPVWTVVAADGEKAISYSAMQHTLRFECEGGAAAVKSVATDVRTPYFVKPDGDDAADGKTFATARKTLKGAMEIPGLAAGDIVYAAPGVYAEGEMWGSYGSNRVVVAEGVGLVGYAGADATVIEGRFADTADKCGPEAMRCVCAKAGAFVRGFTLRNGATAAELPSDSTNANGLNGGNVWANDGATFVDCVISNGVAKYRGGGVGSLYSPGGNYIRCFFRGNKAVDGTGTAASFGNFYGCVFVGGSVYGAYVTVVNSTFLSGASVRGGSAGASAARVYNSVIENSDGGQNAYYRCLLGVSSLATNSTKSDGTLLGQANLAAKLDADYRPLKEMNLVDFGDTNHYLTNFPAAFIRFAGRDFAGGQRIYNGAIDAGAGEYDWRGDFAKKLARKGVAIPAADANVTTNALAGLDLPADESVTVRYLPVADGDCSLALTGNAIVTLDGEALTPADGVYSFAAEAGKSYDLVVVAFSDVTIKSAGVPKQGMILLLR